VLGIPPVVSQFEGIDRIGSRCRISGSVTIMRYGDDLPVISLGDECCLHDGVRLVIGNPADTPGIGIEIGNRVIVNVRAYLSGEGGLTIEDDVLIGPQALLLSAGHEVHGGDPRINRNPISRAPIRIREGAWIGAGAIILQGVTVGRGSVVGAGGVVTRDVPDFAVAHGNPARVRHFRRGFAPDRPSILTLLSRLLRRSQ